MTRQLFGGKAPKPLAWQPLPHMEEWLENLAAEEVSAGYISSARAHLAHFATFCATEGIQHPDEIERRHILRFQTHLLSVTKENGGLLSLAYRKQIQKSVRNWINWLDRMHYIQESPWVNIRVGRVDKQPKPLEDDEIALLFETHRRQAFSVPPFYYHRREAMLVLLYGWGLRLNELGSLSVMAMDMRLDWVTVRNKSQVGSANGEKVLPYGAEIKGVIQRYLRVRAAYAQVGEDALIIDKNGAPLSLHSMRAVITDLGKRASVDVNPHRFRDSFGTTMLDNDVPVERIMKMMGHTQRAQTLAYSRVNNPKLKESHDAVMAPLLHKLTTGGLPR
jgi:integrase/recombinase XerC